MAKLFAVYQQAKDVDVMMGETPLLRAAGIARLAQVNLVRRKTIPCRLSIPT